MCTNETEVAGNQRVARMVDVLPVSPARLERDCAFAIVMFAGVPGELAVEGDQIVTGAIATRPWGRRSLLPRTYSLT